MTVAIRHGAVDLGLPDGLTFEEWLEKGRTYQAIAQGALWWLGDYIRYGARYGERAAQAVTSLGFAPHTAQNAAWVAEKIPPGSRRRELSFSHHAECAALPPDERDAWLDRAESEGMTRADLRREMGKARALAEPAHRHRWRCSCGDEMVEGDAT